MEIPTVTQEQIEHFRKAHFGPNTQAFFAHLLPHRTFASEFTSHVLKSESIIGQDDLGREISIDNYDGYRFDEGGGEYEEQIMEQENDNLGYYLDGVKRTLTDAQIAMFRFSEMQEIERAKRREEEAEARRQEELLAAVEEEEESQEFATQDYATLNKRDRPLAEDTAGSLPWDDGDVGDWEKVQIAEKESSEAKKKQLMMKATFDAPSGKQFFWPIILAEKKD